jgi:hypothetical protein
MFSSNIVRGMQLKHTWSSTFYGGRFVNFRIYFWTWDSPELVKCGIFPTTCMNSPPSVLMLEMVDDVMLVSRELLLVM